MSARYKKNNGNNKRKTHLIMPHSFCSEIRIPDGQYCSWSSCCNRSTGTFSLILSTNMQKQQQLMAPRISPAPLDATTAYAAQTYYNKYVSFFKKWRVKTPSIISNTNLLSYKRSGNIADAMASPF